MQMLISVTLKAMQDFREDCERSWPGSSLHRRMWAICVDSGLRAVLYIRLQQVAINANLMPLARVISRMNLRSNSIDVVPGASFGPGLVIRHPVGIVVGRNVVAGRNLTLLQGTTLGQLNVGDAETGAEGPRLGDTVVVGANAVILGGIEVGSNSVVGASATVLQSVPSSSTVVGSPARIVRINKVLEGDAAS